MSKEERQASGKTLFLLVKISFKLLECIGALTVLIHVVKELITEIIF